MSTNGASCGETAAGCAFIAVAVVVGGFFWLQNDARKSNEKAEADRQRTEAVEKERRQRLEQRFYRAAASLDTAPRSWAVDSLTDPASGRSVPRVARVWSDHAICRLEVEERMDRTRLAGLHCPGINVVAFRGVEVKFDDRDASDQMVLSEFRNSDEVYISAEQPPGKLKYDEFLRRISSGSATVMALQIPFELVDERWVRFSLRGSKAALTEIGALVPGDRQRE